MPSAHAPRRYTSAAAEFRRRHLENWAQAESEIMLQREKARRRTTVVIEVNGVRSLGECDPNGRGGYSPGEFQSGAEL